MIGVLARLQWMTLRGRVVRSIRLLRQPKYLVGSIVGLAWIGVSILRPMLHSHVSIGAAPWTANVSSSTPAFHRIAALVVTVLLPLPWLLPWGRLGLPFREAELTMLLQAPLTRREVIQYGLLKSELGVVFGALIMSRFAGGGGSFAWLLGFLGTWIVFEFWHLNGKWRGLFNLRQTELTAAVARGRRLFLTIGLLGFYALLLAALVPFASRAAAAWHGADYRQVMASLAALEWPPLLVAVLTPAWWLTAPMFAAGGMAFAAAAVPTVVMVLAQRELVLRSRARFEESALEHAKTQETKRSPARRLRALSSRARSRRPFDLNRPGRPEAAVVWKNAMRVSRVPWGRVAFGAAALLVSAAVLPAILRLPALTYGLLAAFGGVLTVLLPLLGGMVWNNDLRGELGHIELVRTWPVSAQAFMLAEVVAPALLSLFGSTFGAGLVLTSLFGSRLRQALTGEPAALLLLPRAGEFLGVGTELAAVLMFVSLVPVAAAASFLSSALQNLAVVLMPAWMAQGADRNKGVAAIGQRLVFSSALGLAFMLALIPSALLVGTALLGQSMLGIPWSAWEFPLWGTLGALPLFAGGWLIVMVAAPVWMRLDPSQEILEIGR
jgi:ABC-2 type transport system permease protein